MNSLVAALKGFIVIAFLALAAGCASDFQEKENLAVAAGFKAITPTKPDQAALLSTLPTDKVTQVTYNGKIYYVLPDVKNNQAFVGGPKQYQSYQQLRLARQISNENLEAAEMNQAAAMNWGAWGGWGGMGGPGWY
ncbi:hypothetical protein [uncultured Lamprocystis sp.]|jgi:hypothetical protein|uniref:hypothetical protein n=1 Tax=uncultured Lamprocystis sp. TaxID=543132 RepID=UPI0025DFC8B4|nr:hypothetical protein [uncultured Lamprocystis sp.]